MLLIAVPCAGAVTPFGARPANRASAKLLDAAPHAASSTDGSRIRVIVEFTSLPRTRTPVASHSDAQSAPPFQRFRDDLRQLRAAGTASAVAAEDAVEVTQEYSRAFSGVALSVTPSERTAIEKLPYVLRVHPDLAVTATALEPGVALVGADKVWQSLGSRGAGVTVAILDTGVDYGHSALGGGFGPGFKVAGGYDFVNKDDDPMDDSGHGTHVAGIVAADSEELTGVAPDASLFAYKVLNNSGQGWSSDILAAIERTVDPNGDGDTSDHVAVVNMSLGAPGYSDDAMSRAVDNAVSAGVVFVIAAGNLGTFQSVSSPGTADAAITVGATNAQDALAPFTSKGPAATRYGIKPDVVAPGVDVRSARAGGGTLVASGTSMAAPHVAGAAALLRALHPDWTPADVKSALVTTAAPLANEAMAVGAGRIDALRAATVTTRVMPEQLAFGVIDGQAPAWSATRKFVVTNRGTATQSYEAVTTGARDGVRVEVTPATVSLQPGESAELTLKLDVENAKVPYPAAGSLSHSGVVELRTTSDVLRVPWAFIKAARMRVRYTDEAAARVFLGRRSATPPRLQSVGRNLFEMLVPPGFYSLVLVTFAEIAPARETTVIVRDNEYIEGLRDFDLSPADAPYRLTFTAKDESGRLLREEAGVECVPFRLLQFRSQDFGHHGLDLIYSTGTWRQVAPYPPHVRTSAVTERYDFISGEVCLDAAVSKFYTFDYAPIRGVTADVSRHGGGAELHAQPTRVKFPASVNGERTLGLYGRFAYMASGEHVSGFSRRWPAPEWSGTVFINRTGNLDGTLHPILDAQTDQAYFGTHPLRVTDGGAASFSSWTPSPTTFVASAADAIEFGLGPLTPTLSFAGVGSGVEVQAQFTGPLNETIVRASPSTFRLFDAEGQLERETAGEGVTVDDVARPVRLDIEALRTHGPAHEGRTLVSARFGGSQSDPLPPTLTSLVVLNTRSQPANRLTQGWPARLRFSAIDFAGTNATSRVKPDATQVWARAAGAEHWRPIAVTIHGEDFVDPNEAARASAGTIFEAALTEITSGQGVFDLRITVEDDNGNTTETTLEAAFEVKPGQHRTRAVRH